MRLRYPELRPIDGIVARLAMAQPGIQSRVEIINDDTLQIDGREIHFFFGDLAKVCPPVDGRFDIGFIATSKQDMDQNSPVARNMQELANVVLGVAEADRLKSIYGCLGDLTSDDISTIQRKVISSGMYCLDSCQTNGMHASLRVVFRSVEKAHFNFHFGNVLYNEERPLTHFIDPDFSVSGLDPLFGFSRFAFSFWHELAAEVEDAVKMVPMSDALMFVLAKQDYGNILSEISEIGGISGLLPLMGENMRHRFYVLTAYCFLRSIRINGSKQPWKTPRSPVIARPEEVLMLGMLIYLEGASVASESLCA